MTSSKPAPHSGDDRTFVIVGSGAAAVAAITTLRQEGFGGRIRVVGREAVEPYDRPKLSKTFLAKPTEPEKMTLAAGFYDTYRAEFIGQAAKHIDVAKRSVTLADGTALTGDALLIATGSNAVVPSFAGGDLSGIFTLRSLDDAVSLSQAAEPGKRVAIVGGGFIGLEAASSLTKRGLSATVVSIEPLPLAARFGDDVAHGLKVYHEGTGVRFVTGTVARFEGEDHVRGVRLEGGEIIDADLVLIGAGAKPATEAIADVDKRADGGIEVAEDLRIADGVWLAGDIAAFPEERSGTVARIEHWRLAQQHGTHAARGMLGDRKPFKAAPFFWSNQGDKRLDYAGYAPEWDRIVMQGEPAKLDFIAYYIRGGKALAACAVGQSRNSDLIAFLHQLESGEAPDVATIERAEHKAA